MFDFWESFVISLPQAVLQMSFLVRCRDAARSSFSFLGMYSSHFLFLFCSIVFRVGVGSVRTATKRAGGTVHNHGGSPGKRLGVKKFSGMPYHFKSQQN
jgi:Ribosomal L27 protein